MVGYMIKHMLEFCEFLKKANANIKDTLIGLSLHFKFNQIDNNIVLFNYGDNGEDFYLIAKGRVDILIPFLKEYELTKREYIDYLSMLYLYNEKTLMLEMLEKNKRIFFVSKVDVINMSFQNKHRYINPVSSNDLIEKIIPKITESKDERKLVIIYVLSCVKTLSEANYFGDNALDQSDQKRTATVFAYSVCHLISLNSEKYISCLQEANNKSKKNNVLDILSSPIFDSLSENTKKYFQKFYASLFSIKKVDKGDYVIREGENITNFYFIRSGNFEMTINKNILDLNELIKYFGGSIEDDKTQYELLYENIKYYQFVKEKKLMKVKLIKIDQCNK
jgi:CRP-like cAMP-binding protein